jgi:hypothetical protein
LLIITLCVPLFLIGCSGNSYESNQDTNVTCTLIPHRVQLSSFNGSKAFGYITVFGQVKNVSEEPLDDVVAVVEYFTKSGQFVKSDSALIEYTPLLVGQTSPFEVVTSDNAAIADFKVSFRHLLGRPITIVK